MHLFSLLGIQDSRITTANTKVHLAGFNGFEDPLRVYFEDRFDEWQSWQNQRNFGRPFVVSVIQLPERNKWLYVGTYEVRGCEWVEARNEFQYGLEPLQTCADFAGRLVIDFARTGRASYLLGDSCGTRLAVHELRPERMHLEEFPGFKKVDLGWPDLEIVVRQNSTSWRAALSNVAGVYLLSDSADGKLYVGSATGEGGIWARWCQYVNGHGKNIELAQLISAMGRDRARAFRFSILEIADVHASRDEILARESHWKRALLTRSYGYNAN